MYKEEYDNIGIVYKYTSPDGNCYIGQTMFPRKRQAEHKRNASQGYKGKFYEAVRKFGWDSFQYEVLYTIIDDDIQKRQDILNEKEVYYIRKYNSFYDGYNSTIGGNQYCGELHPSFGTKLSKEHKKKLKDSRVRQVSQYSASGKFIRSYYSAAEASRETGIDSSSIIKTCKGIYRNSGNFQWKYGNNTEDIPPIDSANLDAIKNSVPFKNGCKPVYQYDLNFNLVKIWESVQQLKCLGYSNHHLNLCFQGKLDFYGKRGEPKYIWTHYPIDISQIKEVPEEKEENSDDKNS